jgi:hypothetical protein
MPAHVMRKSLVISAQSGHEFATVRSVNHEDLTPDYSQTAPALACSLIRKGISLSRTYHTGTRLLWQIPLRIKLLRDHRGRL